MTVTQVAERLGLSRRRIIALIEAGRLPATRLGNQYVIESSNLSLIADRNPGRPKKKGKK